MISRAAICFALLVFARPAVACSCSAASPEKIYGGAKHVVIVRVESVRAEKRDGETVQVASFEVVETLKGHAAALESIVATSGSCTDPLTPGQQYLVAFSEPEAWPTVCSGSYAIGKDGTAGSEVVAAARKALEPPRE